MTLKEKYRKLLQDAKAIAELAISNDRSLTDDEKARISNVLEDAKKVKTAMQTIQEIDELDAQMETVDETKKRKQQFNGSLADRFLSDEAYKAWLAGISVNGRVPDSSKGLHSPTVMIGKTGLFKKDLVTGTNATNAGVFVNPDITGLYEPIGRYPTVLRDLISVRQTTSDTVEFVQQTVQVHEAAAVPEANITDVTGYTGEVSGEKPQGSIGFRKVTENVKTIAVWIPATKRALSDAAQIRGIIDQELRDDLSDELENQLFNGDGVGENFRGLENQAGTLNQAYATSIFHTTRKAITALKVTGRTRPTAWTFNPEDWETVELLRDTTERFHAGGPFAQGQKTLWGVPVVESFHQTAGTAWLGNWKKAVLWDREEANVMVSDSHADFFIRNMIAILGEMRAAFGLLRPSGFIEVDLS